MGAIGLMQLLPETAKGIAARTGGSKFRVADLYDPEINVRYGAWYLRHLIQRYGDERTALAAYNAGEATVDPWLERGRPSSSTPPTCGHSSTASKTAKKDLPACLWR